MNDIKIIFFDIDGTMLPFGHTQLPEKMVQTLHRLRQRGIRVCIATGRAPSELPRFENVEFDALLTFNGSLCYDAQGLIYSKPLPPQAVAQVLSNAAGLGLAVTVATADRLAANGWEQNLADYYAIVHRELIPDPEFEAVARQQVYQIMVGVTKPQYQALMAGVAGAEIAAWWPRAVDVIPAGVGKGVGILQTLAHYGLTVEQAMAFGDGNNDLDMLRTVGLGVAMENASPELKAVAKDRCGSVDADGIYHYCLAHGLI